MGAKSGRIPGSKDLKTAFFMAKAVAHEYRTLKHQTGKMKEKYNSKDTYMYKEAKTIILEALMTTMGKEKKKKKKSRKSK